MSDLKKLALICRNVAVSVKYDVVDGVWFVDVSGDNLDIYDTSTRNRHKSEKDAKQAAKEWRAFFRRLRKGDICI